MPIHPPKGEHNQVDPINPTRFYSKKPEPDNLKPDCVSVKCRFVLDAHLSTRTDPTTQIFFIIYFPLNDLT